MRSVSFDQYYKRDYFPSTPVSERGHSIRDLAEEMQGLVSRQQTIEKELEQIVQTNLQLSSKLERLTTQLLVQQEEKVFTLIAT